MKLEKTNDNYHDINGQNVVNPIPEDKTKDNLRNRKTIFYKLTV